MKTPRRSRSTTFPNPEDPLQSQTTPPAKHPYAPPRLTVYGDLRALTLKDGGTLGMNDGGAGPDKTAF
jgi:hypothetical protein